MTGRVLLLLALLIALAMPTGVARAQTLTSPMATGNEAAARDTGAGTEALIAVLEDDAARAALIEQLRDAAGEPRETAEGETISPAPVHSSFARHVAALTLKIAQDAGQVATEVYAWATSLGRVLEQSGEQTLEVLTQAAISLLLVIVATISIFLVLGIAARRLYRRLARRAAGQPVVGTALFSATSIVVDALNVVLAWAGGYAIALYLLGDAGKMDIRQSLYLNAFLLIEGVKVVLRGVISPNFGDLRLLPLSDVAAKSLYFWLSRLVSLLGYGLLLVVPIVSANINAQTGQAVAVIIAFIALVIATTVIMRKRLPVRRTLRRHARENDGFTGRFIDAIARVWHLIAHLYVVTLFVIFALRPGNALAFIGGATWKSLLAVILGIAFVTLITRMIEGGLRLPAAVNSRLPALQSRLDAFIPTLLKILRALVLVVALLVIAHAWQLIDLAGWITSAAGEAVIARIGGVALIAVFAFVLWLAVASWIDWRLNPSYGRPATARERTLLSLLRNAVTIAIVVFAVMSILSEIGIDIAPLLAGAGVVGLAIGFGAQKLVQDIITGIFIQFENAINEGDVVTAAGLTGVVEKLTIRSVSLRDLYGTYHIIPFSSVDSVSNFMRGFGYHVAEIGIAYREDIEVAKGLMHEAFDRLKEDEEIGPTIIGPLDWHGLTAFGDSAVVLRARIKTLPGKQWSAGRAYNALIKTIFDAHGIEIPFPHMTVYFGEDRDGNAPPAHLLLERAAKGGQPAAG